METKDLVPNFSCSVIFYFKSPLNVQHNISHHRKSVIDQYSIKRQKGIERARNKQGKKQSVIFYHRNNLDCIIHVLLKFKKVSRKLNTRSAAEKNGNEKTVLSAKQTYIDTPSLILQLTMRWGQL
jgi:hypothetical protein